MAVQCIAAVPAAAAATGPDSLGLEPSSIFAGNKKECNSVRPGINEPTLGPVMSQKAVPVQMPINQFESKTIAG